jgi:hypothetical protein
MPTPEDLDRIADMGFSISDAVGEAAASQAFRELDALGDATAAKILGDLDAKMVEAQRRNAANYTPGERQAQPARTPYVCIDLETTGLDDANCQILEFGAVIEDWVTPFEKLKSFRCYIYHDQIVGEPYALAMNAAILKKMAGAEKMMRAVLLGDPPVDGLASPSRIFLPCTASTSSSRSLRPGRTSPASTSRS